MLECLQMGFPLTLDQYKSVIRLILNIRVSVARGSLLLTKRAPNGRESLGHAELNHFFF
jgi:hypothetical protein